MDRDEDAIPTDLHLAHEIEESELEDARIELTSIAWFVSLLTRVDGLVLLTPELELRGFGVEITISDDPRSVRRACDASAARTEPLDPTHYGMRHRSMMRYCGASPGSVGFVISQDGDVRAFTLVDDALVMWDQLKLQEYELPEAATGDEVTRGTMPESPQPT